MSLEEGRQRLRFSRLKLLDVEKLDWFVLFRLRLGLRRDVLSEAAHLLDGEVVHGLRCRVLIY